MLEFGSFSHGGFGDREESWRLRSGCGTTHNAVSAVFHTHNLCEYLGVKVRAFMLLPCPINTIQCGTFDAMCGLELSLSRVYFS